MVAKLTPAHHAWIREITEGACDPEQPHGAKSNGARPAGEAANASSAATGDEDTGHGGVPDVVPIDDPLMKDGELLASTGNLQLKNEILAFFKSKGATLVKVIEKSGALAKLLGPEFVAAEKAAELLAQAGPELWHTFKAAASRLYDDATKATVVLYRDVLHPILAAVGQGKAAVIVEEYREAVLDLKIKYEDRNSTFKYPVFDAGSHCWPPQFDKNPKLVDQSTWTPKQAALDSVTFNCTGVGHVWNGSTRHVSFGPLTIIYYSDGRFMKDINVQVAGQVQPPFHVEISVTAPSKSNNMGSGGRAFVQLNFKIVLSWPGNSDFQAVTSFVNVFLQGHGDPYFQPKSVSEDIKFPDGWFDMIWGKPTI